MSTASGINGLLLRWQEARDEGQSLTAEELCTEQPELVEDLRRHIQALQSMENRLGVTMPSDTASTPTASMLPTLPGYELLQVLDQGGMGVVYKARDVLLKRHVALKMILAGAHAAPSSRARFRIEVEAVARLQHPNIVPIYEVREHEGQQYFAMELLEGGNLAQRLANGAMPAVDAAALVETLARAIDAAHRRGIIHRDLKPSNVIFTTDGVPKITDFGLAKRLDATAHTQTGAVVGTPGYMAPEQAAGRAKDVGPQADVYALGAVLYEALTGRPPFRGETPLDTLLQVMQGELLPPSRHVRVPRDLETICLKCLARHAEDRYASGAELADDLMRFRKSEPIHGRRLPLWRRVVPWVFRHPTRSFVVAVLLCLSMAGMWALRAREVARAHARELAPEARKILRHYCYECHGIDAAHTERGLDVLNHQFLIASDRKFVVPGYPANSRLIQRVGDESMPPLKAEELPRLSLEEQQVLKDWIAGGAPPFPEVVEVRVPPPEPTALATSVKQIFKERCYDCHKYDEAMGGIKILNHDMLVAKRKVVVPFRPQDSELYRLVAGEAEPRMPPRTRGRMEQKDVDTIRRWIAEGAGPFPRGK
jgi:tRNA A-37 threonylcarbamoyl transferase component Bud32/mono/diheme cytochrome c family protein